jgi:Flp pilus assembly protein TadD
MTAYEIRRRRRWAKAAYPGDPRWATDWTLEADPAYKFRAFSPLHAGRYAEARLLFLKALESEPGDAGILYNLACAEALGGEPEQALAHLNEAVSAHQRYRESARADPDLASIRGDPRFPS